MPHKSSKVPFFSKNFLEKKCDDKRQPWPNADKKSGPQLLRGPKLLSFGPKLFKY